MNETGVIATEEEQDEIRSLAASAQASAMLSSRFGPHAADVKLREASKRCHEIALTHGLPEIQGFYGMAETGEFVCQYDAEEDDNE